MRYLSLFSGIGSPEQALKNTGKKFELVGFSEIDKFAVKSYCAVHGVDESLNLGDITKINIENLPNDIDLITHGSPCQDFSIAGKGKGGDLGSETRSSLIWNTVEICKHCKPKYVVWENVKNVLSKKHIHNFEKYLNEMEKIGYKSFYKVLNAKDFGVPQNRERLFVISIRENIKKDFMFLGGYDNGIRLRNILETEVDEKYYVNTEKAKKIISEYTGDLATSHSIRPRKFEVMRIGGLFDDEKGKHQAGSIYDIGGLAPTLDTMQGGYRQPCIITKKIVIKENTKKSSTIPIGDVNGVILENFKIRRLTPKECWRLMGFKDNEFEKAAKVCSNTQLYKQAGNSIVVNVMEEIFKQLI